MISNTPSQLPPIVLNAALKLLFMCCSVTQQTMDGVKTVALAGPFAKYTAATAYFCGPIKQVVDGKKLDHSAMLTADTLFIAKADGTVVSALSVDSMDKIGTNADATSRAALKEDKASPFIIIQMKDTADDTIFTSDGCSQLLEPLTVALSERSTSVTSGPFKKPSECTVKMRMPKALVEDTKAQAKLDALSSGSGKEKKDKGEKKEKKDKGEKSVREDPPVEDKKEKPPKEEKKEKKEKREDTPVDGGSPKESPPVKAEKKKDKGEKSVREDPPVEGKKEQVIRDAAVADKKEMSADGMEMSGLVPVDASASVEEELPLHFPPPRVENVMFNKATGLLDLTFPYTQPAPASIRRELAKADPSVVSMMPSLNFAAYYWAGHVAYHATPTDKNGKNVELRVGVLTEGHLYVGANFHYERCIPISSISTIFLRARLRNHSSHVRIFAVFKVKGPSCDCCFEFANEQEAVRVISTMMRLALDINRNHDILTAPFNSLDDPQFNFSLQDESHADKVVPLPLVEDFKGLFGRYRQRLVDIYAAKAPERMEDVDRVLYMFPHEEDTMVAKLQQQYGLFDNDYDESDILGVLSRRKTTNQQSFIQQNATFSMAGVPSFLQPSGSPIRQPGGVHSPLRQPNESISVYDPSPFRTTSSPVGRYEVSGTRPLVGNPTVGDVLTSKRFSWRMFQNATQQSRDFVDVTTDSTDPDAVARVRRLASLVGDDEERFLSLVAGGGGVQATPQNQQNSSPLSGRSRWSPSLETLHHSADFSNSRSPANSAPSPAKRTTQIRSEHKLWPYL